MSVFRQFYCAEDESTLSISYQYVYCRGYLKPFEHYVSITVADRVENYTFYSGDSVPMNDSGVSGASSFYTESDSAMFDCIDYFDGSSDAEVVAVNVSYQFTSTVNRTDGALVHFYQMMNQKEFWFMITDVEIRCLGPSVCLLSAHNLHSQRATILIVSVLCPPIALSSDLCADCRPHTLSNGAALRSHHGAHDESDRSSNDRANVSTHRIADG